jgi:hypothetical protein
MPGRDVSVMNPTTINNPKDQSFVVETDCQGLPDWVINILNRVATGEILASLPD